eukprot:Gregarina_sp_Poly_1__5219@NODE_2767_length_1746_cov_40_184038_g1746_i0_p1_GENE_NODE_2767_length_1746_cov_40_184038_g1746_i0NODE_2767_length_1746_cov_40_184038_g1746_i0_p1_ORF_typecomplete_len180_score29_57NAD_binding_1/PF00175_21/0_15NAD_binding_1/PF00175_21/0_065TMEM189_B_dmain/PF10520_9/0_38_NODE_2767_length_1746_cov_40_184038_g1746_i0147686
MTPSRNMEGIILRRELEDFASQFPSQFRLHLLVDEPATDFNRRNPAEESSLFVRKRQRVASAHQLAHTSTGGPSEPRLSRSMQRSGILLSPPSEHSSPMGPVIWSPAAQPDTSTGADSNNRKIWGETYGQITLQLIKQHFPPPEDDPLVFMIGPPGMLINCVRPALRQLGFNLERVLPF